MSKIRDELFAASGKTPNRGEAEGAFLNRVVVAISKEITDAVWNAISGPAQDWNNSAAEAIKAGKAVPPFPDVVAAAPAGRGRGRTPAPAPAPEPYEPAEKDEVSLTTKRGKVVEGFVVGFSEDGTLIYINAAVDGEEKDDEEFVIASCTIIPKEAEAELNEEREPGADEVPGDTKIEVSDTVEYTTKRGKVIVGNVVVLDGDELVMKDAAGNEHELLVSSAASFNLKVKNAGVAATPAVTTTGRGRGGRATLAATPPAPAPTGRGRTAAATPAEPPPAAKPLSLGGHIRQIMCADPAITIEAVDKKLKALKLDYREATLKAVYSDTLGVFTELRANGKMT